MQDFVAPMTTTASSWETLGSEQLSQDVKPKQDAVCRAPSLVPLEVDVDPCEVPIPLDPTAAERESHALTHLRFRTWCP